MLAASIFILPGYENNYCMEDKSAIKFFEKISVSEGEQVSNTGKILHNALYNGKFATEKNRSLQEVIMAFRIYYLFQYFHFCSPVFCTACFCFIFINWFAHAVAFGRNPVWVYAFGKQVSTYSISPVHRKF